MAGRLYDVRVWLEPGDRVAVRRLFNRATEFEAFLSMCRREGVRVPLPDGISTMIHPPHKIHSIVYSEIEEPETEAGEQGDGPDG